MRNVNRGFFSASYHLHFAVFFNPFTAGSGELQQRAERGKFEIGFGFASSPIYESFDLRNTSQYCS